MTRTKNRLAAVLATATFAAGGGVVGKHPRTSVLAEPPPRRIAEPTAGKDAHPWRAGSTSNRRSSPTRRRSRTRCSRSANSSLRCSSAKSTDSPFRSETTLLPYTGVVVIDGQPVEVLLSQYMAYLDGRITEVALDRYAQADDGSVWYLGEDVYDYEDGTVVVTEGTWLAGRDGPPAMIMPGDPQVGQVFRPRTDTGHRVRGGHHRPRWA